MASVDARKLGDGTTSYRVRWRQDGRARSLTFVDAVSAETFRRNIDTYGPAEAFRIINLIDDGIAQLTLTQWCTGHIDTLTGVEEGTRARYRRYLHNDITPTIGYTALCRHRNNRQPVG